MLSTNSTKTKYGHIDSWSLVAFRVSYCVRPQVVFSCVFCINAYKQMRDHSKSNSMHTDFAYSVRDGPLLYSLHSASGKWQTLHWVAVGDQIWAWARLASSIHLCSEQQWKIVFPDIVENGLTSNNNQIVRGWSIQFGNRHHVPHWYPCFFSILDVCDSMCTCIDQKRATYLTEHNECTLLCIYIYIYIYIKLWNVYI